MTEQQYRHNERGMALLMVLGLLTVVLMVGVGFAFSTLVERQTSAASADLVRCRLLAESGVERVLGMLKTQYDTGQYPADSFFAVNDSSSPWYGQQLIASINANDQVGIEEALNLRSAGLNITPQAVVDQNVGWLPMYSTRKIGGTPTPVLTGRVAYVVIDESGKLDPNAVVSAEDMTQEPRSGASVTEIALADAGLQSTDLLREKKPAASQWTSLAHIARATNVDQDEFSRMAQVLFPHSLEPETFWRDANANGKFDAGEEEPRMDLSGNLTLTGLYDLFVGPNKASGDDDSAWLKETDNSPWVQQWRQQAGISVVEARRRIAAQVAVNILDYVDSDNVRTIAHLDANGNIRSGSGGVYTVYGVEQVWGVSEVAMRINSVPMAGSGGGGGGGPYVVVLKVVHNGSASRELSHYAVEAAQNSYSNISKAGAGGGVLDMGWNLGASPFNGFKYDSCGGIGDRQAGMFTITYTITALQDTRCSAKAGPNAQICSFTQADFESVLNGGPKVTKSNGGGFTTTIESVTSSLASITDLNVTPSFSVEAFFPFSENANVNTPPGDLTVHYEIDMGTENRGSDVISGSLVVPLTNATNVDGGTLMFSSGYIAGPSVKIVNAFAPLLGKNRYRITSARIVSVTLASPSGDAYYNVAPVTPSISAFLAEWVQDAATNLGTTLYAAVRAADALYNGRGEQDADFTMYWTKAPNADAPNAAPLSSTDQADVGSLAGTFGYTSSPYSGVAVKNSALTRLGELGRVSSYQPGRSLRLWAANAADQVGHDAHILDLFKIGAATHSQGRVNINSRREPVLQALFKGATTVDTSAAINALLAARNAGVAFANIGDFFGGVAGISGSDPRADALEEAAVVRLAELVSTRGNYFTALVVAQAIQDVGGISYDSNGDGNLDATARHGQISVRKDSKGNVLSYVDKVLGEQKVVATLRRDSLTNETVVQSYRFLDE